MWTELNQQVGTNAIPPKVRHEIGIYGGAQGIWVDSKVTRAVSDDCFGIAVSVLHTGTSYPDDLTGALIWCHYPRTQRPPGRDLAEIEATKNAKRFNLPVFVITGGRRSGSRDVCLGWVHDWDDDNEVFEIRFDGALD